MPFHRWVGGKRRLADAVLGLLPPGRRLIVPFYGGGGESHLAIGRRTYLQYILSDVNADLIAAHVAIRDDPASVVARLRAFARQPQAVQQARYASLGRLQPAEDGARAVRFLILVGCAFNGLWRVNRLGRYTAPWGKPLGFSERSIHEVSYLLRQAGVSLSVGDFGDALAQAGRGDVVYCDPPYIPLSATARHTAYTSDGFPHSEQLRLAEAMREATRRGARCFVSNSATPATLAVYPGTTHVLRAPRSIAARASSRGDVNEYLIEVKQDARNDH